MPLHFSRKHFEIFDFDPPNNLTSHYGACHFGYNLALKISIERGIIPQDFSSSCLKRNYIQNGTHHSGMWGLNPKFQSQNEVALIENSSFCGGVGACAASFFEQRR